MTLLELQKNIKILFSSPFSTRAVDFLESFNVPLYKISSFEITDLKLIKYIASKKKPIIISTGMASYKEIDIAINTIKNTIKKLLYYIVFQIIQQIFRIQILIKYIF